MKVWLNNACQTVCEPPEKKFNLGGRIRGIGEAMRSGELTNGALMVRLRRSKKKNKGSVSSVETKSGGNGSAVIATSIAGTLIPVSGEENFGPTTSMVKGGRSGNERQEEGQYYRQQSFYRGGPRGGKKGGKGAGEGGRGK